MGTGFSLNYPELDAYIKEATDSEYLTIKEKKSEEKEMNVSDIDIPSAVTASNTAMKAITSSEKFKELLSIAAEYIKRDSAKGYPETILINVDYGYAIALSIYLQNKYYYTTSISKHDDCNKVSLKIQWLLNEG